MYCCKMLFCFQNKDLCVRRQNFIVLIITARKRSLGQGNIFASVCHSVHRGVCFSACLDTPPPVVDTPTWGQAPPRCSACWEIRSTSGRYVSYWNAILLPPFCSPGGGSASVHAGIPHPPGPGTLPPLADPPWDRAPPGAEHAGRYIRSTSGWYASYWNPILLKIKTL